MAPFEIVALAVALAMDATAVAAARGLATRSVKPTDALRVALFFGAFQAAMPLVGGFIGSKLASRVAAWDHWVILVVLGGIGAKMIYEARGPSEEHRDTTSAPRPEAFGFGVLTVLAIATSIDALAAGVPLALAEVDMVAACAVIGLVTGALSFGGVYAGRRFGARLGKRLGAFGGVVLIALAVKTLVEHLRAGE